MAISGPIANTFTIGQPFSDHPLVLIALICNPGKGLLIFMGFLLLLYLGFYIVPQTQTVIMAININIVIYKIYICITLVGKGCSYMYMYMYFTNDHIIIIFCNQIC